MNMTADLRIEIRRFIPYNEYQKIKIKTHPELSRVGFNVPLDSLGHF